jgi:long-subunit fatty acid transport protein
MLTRHLRLGASVALFSSLASLASAQTGQTAQIPLQFDFLNPGARSLGLGSAFVAIADDATSAFTNPAGLTGILRPEASLELRYRRLDTTYLTGGRLSGTVTGHGVDTTVGPAYGISQDRALRPYFLSFVYPTGRWSLAAYRHELVLQSNPFQSQGAFRQIVYSDTFVDNNARQRGLTGRRSIAIDNYGAAASYRFSEYVSIGLGLAVYRFEARSDFASLLFLGGDQFASADVGSSGLDSTTAQVGHDTRAAVNVGALIAVTRKVRVGAVFRQSATFRFDQTNVVPGSPAITKSGRFRTPGVLGVGIRLQPTNEWTLAFDLDRVQYSNLRDDFIAYQVDPADLGTISVRDGTELHFAAEYTLTSWPHTPSIRVGAWYDPSHSVHYATNFSNSDADVRLRAVFPRGEDLWHFSVGAGLPLSDDYEVNAGADFTKGRRYVSASVVVRLGR